MYGSLAHPRRNLPAKTATLLLSVLPRGYDFARSAFGVLVAPAAANAVLAHMYSVAQYGRGHDTLHKQCVFLRRVGSDERLRGPRVASDAALATMPDVVSVQNTDFEPQLEEGKTETALIRLHALGRRNVPIVFSRLLCRNMVALEKEMRVGAQDPVRAQRLCKSVRQRGGICVALADALGSKFVFVGVGLDVPDLRLPDLVLSAQ